MPRSVQQGIGFAPDATMVTGPWRSCLICLCYWLICAGCGTSPEPRLPSSADSLYEFNDRLQRKVHVTNPPKRIVSLSPATTELVFALEAGSLLVGATDYCDYPSAALNIPRVGSGPVGTVSLETIVAKQPDMVLCKFDTHQPLIESLDRLEIPVIALGPESLAELFEEATWLGHVLDRQQQADRLIEQMKQRASQLTAMTESPNYTRRRVFYQVWPEPLMTVGQGAFIDQLLELAGLDNVTKDVPGRYPIISAELVVQRDPEVIIVPASATSPLDVGAIVDRPGWNAIQAVKDRAIYAVDANIISRCGPRMLDAVDQIQAAVGQPDLQQQPADKAQP